MASMSIEELKEKLIVIIQKIENEELPKSIYELLKPYRRGVS